MALLIHGTTRRRAESIRDRGPDPDFVESPRGGRAESFCTYLGQGPFLFGRPEEYACQKAKSFPAEGGAAIIEVEVPDEIIALAVSVWLPLSQGLVQFDEQAGLEELIAAWPALSKHIRAVDCP